MHAFGLCTVFAGIVGARLTSARDVGVALFGSRRRPCIILAHSSLHKSIETTHIYVEADLAMKERALSAVRAPSVNTSVHMHRQGSEANARHLPRGSRF